MHRVHRQPISSMMIRQIMVWCNSHAPVVLAWCALEFHMGYIRELPWCAFFRHVMQFIMQECCERWIARMSSQWLLQHAKHLNMWHESDKFPCNQSKGLKYCREGRGSMPIRCLIILTNTIDFDRFPNTELSDSWQCCQIVGHCSMSGPSAWLARV